jgi:hypothetical protein
MPAAPFQWKGDVGVTSVKGIEALARSSGVNYNVTSTFRAGDPGYHGSNNAVDMATSTTEMAKLAAYLFQYSAYLLELIHSGGGGFFVKDGIRGHTYPADIVQQHYNHVHCATTMSALKAASAGGLAIPAGAVVDDSKKGCLPTTAGIATGLIAVTYTIGDVLWTHL